MKKTLFVAILLLMAGMSTYAPAGNLKINGDPGPLIIVYGTAGFDPDPVTDATTSYDINDTVDNMKIIGTLDAAMPPFTELRITLAAPTGAVSLGQVTLSTVAQDLVTGIDRHAMDFGLPISYEFAATVAAGVIPSSIRTVTVTLTDM
jgi:hypothetical protein